MSEQRVHTRYGSHTEGGGAYGPGHIVFGNVPRAMVPPRLRRGARVTVNPDDPGLVTVSWSAWWVPMMDIAALADPAGDAWAGDRR